jgi:hypothetical protein
MDANALLTPSSENDTLPAENDKENETPQHQSPSDKKANESPHYNARITAPDREYFHPNIGLFYVTQATPKAKPTKGPKPKKDTKS